MRIAASLIALMIAPAVLSAGGFAYVNLAELKTLELTVPELFASYGIGERPSGRRQ